MPMLKLNKLILLALLILYAYSHCSNTEGYFFNAKTKVYTKLFENCMYTDYNGTDYYCSDCNSGFVLKDNQCQAFTIQKCIYGNINVAGAEECTQCEPGFHPAENKLSCETDPTSAQTDTYKSNCGRYQNDFGTISCVECASDAYYLASGVCNENPTAASSPSEHIVGCQKYKKQGNNLICEYCNEARSQGVKLGQSQCVDLATFDANVNRLHLHNAHQILECKANYIVNNNDVSCDPYPASVSDEGYVENCVEYIWNSQARCSDCKDGWRREGQTCVQVPSNEDISNCYKYSYESSDTPQIQCSSCHEGYWFGTLTNKHSECVQCPQPPAPTPAPVDPVDPSSANILMFGLFVLIINIVFI